MSVRNRLARGRHDWQLSCHLSLASGWRRHGQALSPRVTRSIPQGLGPAQNAPSLAGPNSLRAARREPPVTNGEGTALSPRPDITACPLHAGPPWHVPASKQQECRRSCAQGRHSRRQDLARGPR